MLGFESHLFLGASGQDTPQKGTQRARLHSPFFVYVCNHCGVVCSYKHYVVQTEVLKLLGPERLPLVPNNLCAT